MDSEEQGHSGTNEDSTVKNAAPTSFETTNTNKSILIDPVIQQHDNTQNPLETPSSLTLPPEFKMSNRQYLDNGYAENIQQNTHEISNGDLKADLKDKCEGGVISSQTDAEISCSLGENSDAAFVNDKNAIEVEDEAKQSNRENWGREADYRNNDLSIKVENAVVDSSDNGPGDRSVVEDQTELSQASHTSSLEAKPIGEISICEGDTLTDANDLDKGADIQEGNAQENLEFKDTKNIERNKNLKVSSKGKSKKFAKLHKTSNESSSPLRRSGRQIKPVSYATFDNQPESDFEPESCDGVIKVLLYLDPHDTETSLKVKVDGGHIKGYMFASDTIASAKQQCTSWSTKSKIKIPCFSKIPRSESLATPTKKVPKLHVATLPAFQKALKTKKKYAKKKSVAKHKEKWTVSIEEGEITVNEKDFQNQADGVHDVTVKDKITDKDDDYPMVKVEPVPQDIGVEDADGDSLLIDDDEAQEEEGDDEEEYVPEDISDEYDEDAKDESYVPSRKSVSRERPSTEDTDFTPSKRKRGRPRKGEINLPKPPKVPKRQKLRGKQIRGRPKHDGSKPKPKMAHSGKNRWLIPSKTLKDVCTVKHNDGTTYYLCDLCCYTSCDETQMSEHACDKEFTENFKELKDPYNIDFDKHIKLDGVKTSICTFCEFGALNRYVVEQHILRHHVALPSQKDMLRDPRSSAAGSAKEFPAEDEEESFPSEDPENSNDAKEPKSKYKNSVIMSRYNGVLSRAVGKVDVELCKKLRVKLPDTGNTSCFWCCEDLDENEEPEEHFRMNHYRHICDPYYTYSWNMCFERGMVEYKPDKIYSTCVMCKGPVLTNSLVEHMYVRHGLQHGFPCPICQTDLPSLMVRQKHLYEKHGEASLDRLETKSLRYCSKCSINFAKKVKYEQHMLTYHSLTSKFVCPAENCSFRFILRHDLVLHLHKIHLENIVKYKSDPVLKICEYCGKECSQSYLKQHIKTHHEKETSQNNEDVPPSSTPDNDGPRACKLCDKMTSCKAAYKRHMRNFHTGPHKCPFEECEMIYDAYNNLKAHIKYFHMNRKPSICDICGMKFRSRNQLDTHYTTVHLGQKNFKCEWPGCNKTFGRVYSMRIHYKIHTGEKPRKCQHCDYTTLQKASLNWHMKSRHPEVPFSASSNDGRNIQKSQSVSKAPTRRRTQKKVPVPEIQTPEVEYRAPAGTGDVKEETVSRSTLASIWASNQDMVASWNNAPPGEQPADYTYRTIQNAAQHLHQHGQQTIPNAQPQTSHQHPPHNQPSQTDESALNELAQVAVSAASFTQHQQQQYFQQWPGNKDRQVKVSNLTEAMQASGLWPPPTMGFMFPPDQ